MITDDHPAAVTDEGPAAEVGMLLAFLGDPRGLTVLDVASRDLSLPRQIVRRGAADVTGLVDESAVWAASARPPARYAEIQLRTLDGWAGGGLGRFDAAVSHQAFAGVRNLRRLLSTLHHHLRPQGLLVFSVPHPLKTAGRGPYLDEDVRTRGRAVLHRTFETYLKDLRMCGFAVDELSEGLESPDGRCFGGAREPEAAVFKCVRR